MLKAAFRGFPQQHTYVLMYPTAACTVLSVRGGNALLSCNMALLDCPHPFFNGNNTQLRGRKGDAAHKVPIKTHTCKRTWRYVGFTDRPWALISNEQSHDALLLLFNAKYPTHQMYFPPLFIVTYVTNNEGNDKVCRFVKHHILDRWHHYEDSILCWSPSVQAKNLIITIEQAHRTRIHSIKPGWRRLKTTLNRVYRSVCPKERETRSFDQSTLSRVIRAYLFNRMRNLTYIVLYNRLLSRVLY